MYRITNLWSHRYAKKSFRIAFSVQIFNWTGDSIVNGKVYYKWQVIPPQYDTIKSAFKKLDSIYGGYTISRALPENLNDTITDLFKYQELSIHFDNTVPIGIILTLFSQFPYLKSYRYADRTIPLTDIRKQDQYLHEKIVKIGNDFFKIPLLTHSNLIKVYSLYGSEIYYKDFTDSEQIFLPTDIPIGMYYIQINNFTLKYFHNQQN